MKVLLIDNGTYFKKELARLLGNYQLTTVEQPRVDVKLLGQGFDLVVLSGANGGPSVKHHSKVFSNELRLIKNASIPVIGICLGAQLIAKLHSAELSFIQKNGRRIKGYKRIWKVKKIPLDFNHSARVWASHRWRITELTDELEAWCASNEGIEVFKHKRKPMYGLQFHPEYHPGDNDGRRIFHKIVELATS